MAEYDASLHAKLQDIKVRLQRVYSHMRNTGDGVVSSSLTQALSAVNPTVFAPAAPAAAAPKSAVASADAQPSRSQSIVSTLHAIDRLSVGTRRAAVAASVRSAAAAADKDAFYATHPAPSPAFARNAACSAFWQQSVMCGEAMPSRPGAAADGECADIWEEAQACFLAHPARQ